MVKHNEDVKASIAKLFPNNATSTTIGSILDGGNLGTLKGAKKLKSFFDDMQNIEEKGVIDMPDFLHEINEDFNKIDAPLFLKYSKNDAGEGILTSCTKQGDNYVPIPDLPEQKMTDKFESGGFKEAKQLIQKLGITSDSKETDAVSRQTYDELQEIMKPTVSDEAKTAFGKISEDLPSTKSYGKIAAIAAVGAALFGVLALAFGGEKKAAWK